MNQLENDFTVLVKEYKSTIYTVCAMFADCHDETNDLTQEVLINLWRSFADHQEWSKAWVWRVTMNTCITMDRKKKKVHDNECALTPAFENIITHDETANYQRKYKLEALHRRIHALNPYDRAIIMLWLDGMPYDEIGEIIGISTKNVSVKLLRIKEELKKQK